MATITVTLTEAFLRQLLHPVPKRVAIARVFAALAQRGMDMSQPRLIQFKRVGDAAQFTGSST